VIIENDDFGCFGYTIDGSFDQKRNILRFLEFFEDHKLELLQSNFIGEVLFIVSVSLRPLVTNVLRHLELSISHYSA